MLRSLGLRLTLKYKQRLTPFKPQLFHKSLYINESCLEMSEFKSYIHSLSESLGILFLLALEGN